MVVAQEPLAADVGLQVLKNGGNAVDAAIAVAFALAVTFPSAGNIGGGGFLLVRLANGKTDFLDFRETAPAKASRDMFLDDKGNPTKESIFGWRSSGIPGTVAGLALAHKKFGTQKWQQLVDPAVKLASEGFVVTPTLAHSLLHENTALATDPESKRIFTRDGSPYQVGETIKQPELADTLKRIAQFGAKGFYEGRTARELAAQMQAHGGLITEADLKGYKVIERPVLEGDYKSFHIITAPPPSAGGIGLLQMLAMLDGTDYDSDGPDSAKATHYEAEAMRRFYADRSEYLGDPSFYNVPVKDLLSKAYIEWRRKSIDPAHATPSELIAPGLPRAQAAHVSMYESSDTTHFNIVDAEGNAVALTYTINNLYGSGVTIPNPKDIECGDQAVGLLHVAGHLGQVAAGGPATDPTCSPTRSRIVFFHAGAKVKSRTARAAPVPSGGKPSHRWNRRR